MELKIRNGDYVADGVGGEKRAEGTEALVERALFRLSVRRGSFPFLPTLGSELHLLHREKPSQRLAAARQAVAAALAEETELSVEDVTLEEDEEGLCRVRVYLRRGEEDKTLELTVGGE